MPHPSFAAVLFADVVGSTETIPRLGERAGETWRQGALALLRGQLAATHGREVQHTGDGLFAVFGGASRAAAVAMQRAALQASRRRDVAAPLLLRIGIAAGEVAAQAQDLMRRDDRPDPLELNHKYHTLVSLFEQGMEAVLIPEIERFREGGDASRRPRVRGSQMGSQPLGATTTQDARSQSWRRTTGRSSPAAPVSRFRCDTSRRRSLGSVRATPRNRSSRS